MHRYPALAPCQAPLEFTPPWPRRASDSSTRGRTASDQETTELQKGRGIDECQLQKMDTKLTLLQHLPLHSWRLNHTRQRGNFNLIFQLTTVLECLPSRCKKVVVIVRWSCLCVKMLRGVPDAQADVQHYKHMIKWAVYSTLSNSLLP